MGKVSLQDFETGPPIGEEYATSRGVVLRSDKTEISRVTFEMGGGAQPHSHPEEQCLLVEEGRLQVTLGEGEDAEIYVVGPGQGSFHPADTTIIIHALEDTRIVSFKNLSGGSAYGATGRLQ